MSRTATGEAKGEAKGEVSVVASELAKAATEVADVARASLSSADEEDASKLGLTLEDQQDSEDCPWMPKFEGLPHPVPIHFLEIEIGFVVM